MLKKIMHASLQLRILNFCLPVLILWIGTSCAPARTTHFGVEKWNGQTLDRKALHLSTIQNSGLILNFYSPTCLPCLEEIPAINALYREAKSVDIPFYIAVTSYPEDHGMDAASDPNERFIAVKERLLIDKKKYNIEPPFLIMSSDFRIAKGDSLITGTPETLFFRTKPLIVQYDFIGPLSSASSDEELKRDTRFQFVRRQFKNLIPVRQSSSTSPTES